MQLGANLGPKSILITGAAGFIGSRLVAHFKQQGCTVFVDAAAPAGAQVRAPRVVLSVLALRQATSGTAPDAIIHAAGSGTVARVAAEPAVELPANQAALLAVLEFARLHAPGARVVLLSSAAMYGNAPPTPQNEGQARTPVSLYGLAKTQAEQLAAFYAQQHAVSAAAVRLFSVYGPGLQKQLLWDAMNKFLLGPAEFFGTGLEQRDWVHIDDVCRFMGQLLAWPQAAPFEVFNCAGGVAASTAQVLGLLAQQAGAVAPRFNGQTRAGDPLCLLADCSKAHELLGWQPQVAWRDGVAQYATWFAGRGR